MGSERRLAGALQPQCVQFQMTQVGKSLVLVCDSWSVSHPSGLLLTITAYNLYQVIWNWSGVT